MQARELHARTLHELGYVYRRLAARFSGDKRIECAEMASEYYRQSSDEAASLSDAETREVLSADNKAGEGAVLMLL